MGNQNRTNLTHINDGFSGLSKANQTNKSVERGFSGIASSNKNNGGSNNGSNNTNQTTTKG